MKTKALTQKELFNLLTSGVEVFLYYEFEDACVRLKLVKGGHAVYNSHTKFKGETEFPTRPGSSILDAVFYDPIQISEDDYLNF